MTESDAPAAADSILELIELWAADDSVDDPKAAFSGVVGTEQLSSLSTMVDCTRLDDWDELTLTIVELVAAQEDVDPCEIDAQLNDVINIAALEDLFVSPQPDRVYEDSLVTFSFHGYLVKVASDRTLTLHQRE